VDNPVCGERKKEGGWTTITSWSVCLYFGPFRSKSSRSPRPLHLADGLVRETARERIKDKGRRTETLWLRVVAAALEGKRICRNNSGTEREGECNDENKIAKEIMKKGLCTKEGQQGKDVRKQRQRQMERCRWFPSDWWLLGSRWSGGRLSSYFTLVLCLFVCVFVCFAWPVRPSICILECSAVAVQVDFFLNNRTMSTRAQKPTRSRDTWQSCRPICQHGKDW